MYFLQTHVPVFFSKFPPAGCHPKNKKLQINSFLDFKGCQQGENFFKKQGHVLSEDRSIKKRFRPAAAFKKKLQPFYWNIVSKRELWLHWKKNRPQIQIFFDVWINFRKMFDSTLGRAESNSILRVIQLIMHNIELNQLYRELNRTFFES